MKLVEILGGYNIQVNNEEYNLYEKIKSSRVNFNQLNERQKQVAYDLYMRNTILIEDNGDIETNEPQEFVDISW